MIASALVSVGPASPALTSQSNSTHVPGAHRNLPSPVGRAEAFHNAVRQVSLCYRVTLSSRFKEKIDLSRELELKPLTLLRVWEGTENWFKA